MPDDKKVTVTIRLSEGEKLEVDACADYLGLPLSTFFRYAARHLFNEHRQAMVAAGYWTAPESVEGEPVDVSSEDNR